MVAPFSFHSTERPEDRSLPFFAVTLANFREATAGRKSDNSFPALASGVGTV